MTLRAEEQAEDAAGRSGRGGPTGPCSRLLGALLLALVAITRAPAAEPAPESAAQPPPSDSLPASLLAGACRALFFVVAHRAGYPVPEDGEELRALLRGFYLGLEPEWPDGLRAYPLARPADHPASRLIETRVIAAAPTEIAHHWQVMAQRFGQTPPPVVESPRLILQLVARCPGAIAILAGDELPSPGHWPEEVVIAATIGAPAARARCPLARLRLAFGRAAGLQAAADASGMLTLADSRGPGGRSRAGGPAAPQVPGYRVP